MQKERSTDNLVIGLIIYKIGREKKKERNIACEKEILRIIGNPIIGQSALTVIR